MTFQDYVAEVTRDACEAIDNGDYDGITNPDYLTDEMWCDDCITGNGSGSYTFSTWQAQQNVSELIWDEEFLSELEDMDIDLGHLLRDGAEAIDVTARCLALTGAASDEIVSHFEMRMNKASHKWSVSLVPNAPYLVRATYDGYSRDGIETVYEYAETLDDVYTLYQDILADC